MLTSLKAEQKQETRDTVQKKQAEKSASESEWAGVSDGRAAQFDGLSGGAFDGVGVHYNLGRSADVRGFRDERGSQPDDGSKLKRYQEDGMGNIVPQMQGILKPTVHLQSMVTNYNWALKPNTAFDTGSQLNPTIQMITVFEMPNEKEHSQTEVGTFGIGPAGWVPLEESHRGKKVYDWSKRPSTNEDQIYDWKTFFEGFWQGIPEEKKNRILKWWHIDILGKDDEVPQDYPHNDVELKSFIKGLIQGNELNDSEKGRLQKINGIIDSDSLDNAQQVAYFKSKQGLVSILQENVSRYYKGKQLIPTYLVIRKEGDTPFVPNMDGTIDKSTTYTTDKEIRMIYKLTEEAPDDALRNIAKKTFFFQQQDATDENNRKFETIPAPWINMDNDYKGKSTAMTDNYSEETSKKWTTRKRTANKAAYKNRIQSEIPYWMTKLVEFNKQQEKGAF